MTTNGAICGEDGQPRLDSVTGSFMQTCEPCLAAMGDRAVQLNIDWNGAEQARRVMPEASRRMRRERADMQGDGV